jgi:hypothetical protein
MKRLHVDVGVKDIPSSIRFYRELFNAEPVVTKEDYAKWMLEDPRVNFAISRRKSATGVSHLTSASKSRIERNSPKCASA